MFYHIKEGRGLTSSTSPYHTETNYINDKCRPRSSGNVTETRFCGPGNIICLSTEKPPKTQTESLFITIDNRHFTWLTREFPASISRTLINLIWVVQDVKSSLNTNYRVRRVATMLYCTKSYRLIRRNFLFSLQVNLSKGKQHGKHANLRFKPVTERSIFDFSRRN